MSRTYRKPAYYVEHSDVSYANRELARHHQMVAHSRPWGGTGYAKKVRKDQKLFEQQLAEAKAEFDQKVKDNGGSIYYTHICPWRREKVRAEIRPNYVSRFQWISIDPPSEQQVIATALAKRKKMTRDGHWSETTPRSGFKYDAKKTVRRANKALCKAVVSGDEMWEDKPYPTRKLGKHHVWSWW